MRLACLDGDDAVRAKVHFIAAETQENNGDPNITIAWILVDGLASSRNKQMQLTLFEEAWRDPKLLPTHSLQTALRQSGELTQKDWVTDESVMWAGTPEEHQATLEEYQREVNEIIATLPLRSDSNRAETIKFLKTLGVPNPFNQSQSPTHQSRENGKSRREWTLKQMHASMKFQSINPMPAFFSASSAVCRRESLSDTLSFCPD